MVLPPYLMTLEAAGLSPVYGLTGHEFVRHAVAAVVGHGEGTVGEIAEELAGRPESFFGQGRAFAVQGAKGKEWFDVTITVSPAPGERPPVFHPKKDLAERPPDPNGALVAERDEAEGKDTKVDVQHNSVATVGSTAGSSSSKGLGGMAFALAPVLPGLFVGGAATGNVQPWQSSRESRSQRTVAEPRVLRSDKGSVEVVRRVRYGVRVVRSGTQEQQSFQGAGTLTQRVPTEHLVPAGTVAPRAPEAIRPETARRVRLADSMAPVGVADTAAPHRGGGGLFDTVASVLHPSVTAEGAPGRARLYEATSTATVLEDLPRLLGDGVVGEDLQAKDGRTAASYRMRAEITGVSPAWSTGKTQLRTHQQTQHAAGASAGKGRAFGGGLGPAIGVGVSGNAAVVRGTAMPVATARRARFTQNEQTVTNRQGAEVRGDKALYLATVRFTAEGTGPRSGAMVLDPRLAAATHSMRVWMSLRADEARDIGLPLPPGMDAGEFVEKPRKADENGVERDVERHLAYETGSSVVLSGVDSRPMVQAVTELFGTDPRLAEYLPAFGESRAAKIPTAEESALQRENYRTLVAALSETNLKANKVQLLSTGIPVRLRRKTTMHAHDVLVRVKGMLSDTRYLGDTEDWMVRSHSGVTSSAQSGRSSARSIGGLVLGQARVVPGVLTASARYERHRSGTRRNQAGPTTRTDTLTNGSETAAVFGAGLRLDVDISMTSRPRKLARALAPGSPGRHVPEARVIGGLRLDEQDVRLLTPAEFTLDPAEKSAQAAVRERRTARPSKPEQPFAPTGIGDLAGLVPAPSTGKALRDWQLMETVGDGGAVRDLAFALLAKAAGRSREAHEDAALATEGLAPRLAIEERLSPQALHASLRQATSSGWVVKDLRYERRLTALNGAIGTKLTLANPKFLHRGEGPGTETLVLGGHQSSGQRGQGTSSTVQVGSTVSENFTGGRAGQGVSGFRTTSKGGSETATVSGTVERNAHTPKKAPLHLVQCDLLVSMVAEVMVATGGPYVESASRTLPAEAAVWLTEAQLPPAIRRQAGLDEEPAAAPPGPRAPETGESSRAGAERAAREGAGGAGAGGAERTANGPTAAPAAPSPAAPAARPTAAPTGPVLGRGLPLGFGMIENLPNFVPLLGRLRESLASGPRKGLAEDLLPRQQLKDRNDNVQRLLRVLDRSGSAALLAGAMDGGVTVELFDGRNTPYWAVFKVDRVRDATFQEKADDGRDMEYITLASGQRATARDRGVTKGAEAVVAGSGRPEGTLGGLKSMGGAGGAAFATGSSQREGEASRGQSGVKMVAEAKSAPSARMRVPITASLELLGAGGRVSLARMENLALTHRVLEKDLEALGRVSAPVVAPPVAAGPRNQPPPQLEAWRAAGVRLPMEAQVNGFHGAPRVRELVNSAVKAAGGGDRFGGKGQAAAYALNEAVSTEWMIAALPSLTSAGVDLPPVHATGVEGQDLRASLHARLRQGRVLGVGDQMTFETVGQSHLGAHRPAQGDGSSSAERKRAGRGLAGAGLLNADEFRLNQLMGSADGSSGATGAAGNAAGSWPLVKPKVSSVLVQFTLDVKVVARVTDRGRAAADRVRRKVTDGHALTHSTTAVREMTLPQPVVIRMPEPMVKHMLRSAGAELQDPGDYVGLTAAVAPPPPAS
ncbi:hypothetical protein ABZ401_23750 [Streptomyces sp. NPDC005892]|uniref:hypothetical protein n=1 Tax=Streptomyces sp. NPDC005892 TaxID=3155593 RepID=UPI003400B200